MCSTGTRGHSTCPLLVLFVDGIESVLNGDALEVPGCNFEPKGEMQVDLLDRRCGQQPAGVSRCRRTRHTHAWERQSTAYFLRMICSSTVEGDVLIFL